MVASCWRPPAPWHPAELETEQGPDLLLAPLFFDQRRLAAEPPSPVEIGWVVGGGGGGGADLCF